jgi:hypothetical protein
MTKIKLYTEEDIAKAVMFGRWGGTMKEDYEEFLNKLTPIELPSDEEIQNMGKDVIVYNDTKRGWFVEGLRFMRDKIQGDNK